MNRIHWSVVLCVIQVVLAGLAIYVAPFQYQRQLRKQGDAGIEFYLDHTPPSAERLAMGISFPATVVVLPLNYLPQANHNVIEYRTSPAGATGGITIRDVVFLFLVALLWLAVGKVLDRRRSIRVTANKAYSPSRFLLGITLSLGLMVVACLFVSYSRMPIRQVGLLGIVWSLIAFACAINYRRNAGVTG